MSTGSGELDVPETDGPYACPHFDHVDEETLRRLFSKVAAVRSEDRELFDFTHRRIEVFRTPQGATDTAEVVSEEEIYQNFSENRIGNFAVVIEGEVGTGKSELCAYLAHQLDDDGRPILHVDKDDDLMSLLTDRIPGFYRDQFGEDLPGASEFEQLRDDIENNPRTVANNATSGAILNLRSRGYDVVLKDDQEDDIRDHVREELQQLTERGEYAKEVKFVTDGDYRQKEFLDVFAGGVDPESAVEALNEELWREIRDRYGTASLDDVLQRVGAQFEETRPVIVFEDFSITAMEGKKLRNYMERDKGSDNWDFIVAGTRDSTEVLHTQTAEDRFEFYQTNERNSNSVLFLDEGSAVDFVRPYLGYFKSLDESVSYQRDEETGEFTLQPAPEGSICADCGFCDESFRDLFPFNSQFLQSIYTGLTDDQQSPREFVMKVFEVLEEYYRGYVPAPSSASGLGPLEDPLLIVDEIGEHSEDLAELFRWYGEVDGDEIHVDRRFALAFGIVDGSSIGDLPEAVTATDDTLSIPTTDDTGTGSGGGGGEPGGGGPQPPEKTPVEREIDEHSRKVGPWKEYPDQNAKTGLYIERGLRDALDRLSDGFTLYEGTSLQYKLSSQKHPFVLTNTTGTPRPFQVDVDPDEFRESALRDVLRFGVRREKEPRTADYDALLKEHATQLTGYAIKWRQQLRSTFLNAGDILYKRHAPYDFADFVLASYALVVVFDSPSETLSAETLNDRFADDEDYSLDPAVDSWCRETLDRDQYESLTEMVSYAEYLEEMVGELLAVSSSNLDLRNVRHRLDENPPYEVLSMLGRQYINNIDSRVEFADGPRLRDVADTAYDFRKAIEAITDQGSFQDTIDTVLTELDGLDLDNVEETVQRLETYDGVSPEVLESLKRFVNLSQSDIDDAVALGRRANELLDRGPDTQHQLQGVLMSVFLHHTDAYQQYDDVVLEPGGEVSRLGRAFQEVAQFYVE